MDAMHHELTDDVTTEQWAYEDGCLVVPPRPGLGIELDEAKIETYETLYRSISANAGASESTTAAHPSYPRY